MRGTSSVIIAIFLFSGSAFAQAPKYSNEFLNIGVGARGLAMSKAQVASVKDVTSAYWNPAGLTGIQDNLQVSTQHAEYFAGIAKYDYVGVATRIDETSAIGITMVRFGVDDIPNTTQLIDQNGQVNYDRITTFSAADYGFLVSYAKEIGEKGLSVGGNAKVIYRQVGDMARAWGFGVDVGAQYQFGKWQVGAVGRDITSTFNSWRYSLDSTTIAVFEATQNEIPTNGLEVTLPKVVLGVARKFVIKDKVGIMPEFNVDITTDGKRNVLIPGDPFSFDPNLGLELSYQSIFYIRGGVGNVQRIKAEIGDYNEYTFQPNIGVGVTIKDILSIDYALTDIGDQSVALYSNVFSLKLALNRKT
ncbi:MAG: PorV/PorQ family protein [Flavobacteriales bacterium]|nr:PorV/PorQ family protein [Flavobacteriales bacterium]